MSKFDICNPEIRWLFIFPEANPASPLVTVDDSGPWHHVPLFFDVEPESPEHQRDRIWAAVVQASKQ